MISYQKDAETPAIAVTLENSKFVIKPKDAQRLNKMSQETTFQRILEAKVDVNVKVAKILSNALDWKIDFNAFKSAKQTVFIPITNEKRKVSVAKAAPNRNERDLFNEIEGNRRDVQLNPITEEKPGATGTNASNEFKPAENYPLRQPNSYAEVLLVSASDMKQVIETKIGFKCDDAQMENMGVEKIEEAIRKNQQYRQPFYKYIMVDLDDVTIIIDRFGRKIKKMLLDANIKPEKVVLYAFSSTGAENIMNNCKKAGFRHYNKPNKMQALDVLRHMAEDDEEDSGMTPGGKKIQRDDMLDAKRQKIKNPVQEVTMEQLRREAMQ